MPFMHRLQAAVALLTLLLATPTSAQEAAAPLLVPNAQPGQPAKQGLSVRLGAGALAVPDYLGSKTYKGQPLPYIDATYGNLAQFSVQDGLTVNALHWGGLTAGPAVRIRFGQNESDNRRVLRGRGDLGTAVELGGFVAYDAGPINLRAVVGQDVAGGHKGFVADFGATYTRAVFGTSAGPWLLSAGPSLTLVDQTFNQAYFGVTPSQAARLGKPAYRPNGGVEGLGVSATLVVPITQKIAVTGLVGYNKLVSDASNSPLIRNHVGSSNQFTGGAFLTYQLY